MQTPRLIAPLAAAAALLAAAPAAQARLRERLPEPMQFPGDASASAIRADPGTWLVGARPGARRPHGGPRVRRAADRRRRLRGGARAGARDGGALRSRGLLLYAQPDALRRTKAVADDPLSKSPDAWRAAVADPNLDPPLVTPTSPLIALLDTRLDETHPEFAGSNTSTLGGRPLDNLHGTATAAVAAAPKNDVGILGVWPGRPGAQHPAAARRADLLGLGARACARRSATAPR